LTDPSETRLVAGLQEVLTAVPETIVQVDADFRVRAVNRAESPLFRRVPVAGDRLEEVFRGRTVGSIATLIDQAQREGESEAEIDTGDQLFTATAKRLVNLPLTLLIFQDKTGVRLAEQAVADVVRDRSSFLASVSNELRTPLTAVLGYANLLAEPNPSLDEGVRTAMVQDMTDQAWDLAGIVEDLLAVARTEIGELSVVSVPVNLRANVSQVIESMGARSAQITVTGDNSISGLGDPARFRQIVRNLLSNALSHGAEPFGVEISGDDEQAVLVVSDGGRGVPEELLDSIFDQYVSGSDGDAPGRVGIGLWISRELTSLMGGRITYRRQGDSTVFRVAIPRFVRDSS
jgi:two-component system sensor histidine kinase MtrB